MSTATTTHDFTEFVTETDYSPYGVHVVLNNVIASLGHDKVVPPQFLYNYVRNGLIDNIKGSAKGRRIDNETTLKWVTKYVTKNFS